MTSFHLDYESRSSIPLDERGLDNYVRDPSTEVILAAYAEGDHRPKLWEPRLGPIPGELREALEDPFVTIHAWNATFERLISRYVLGIHKPVSEWRDTMVQARYISLPGSLEDAGEILGLTADQKKLDEGKRLIKLFTEPAVEGGQQTLFGVSKAAYRDWNTDPADWALFSDYCKQDIVAERTIGKKLAKFSSPESEQRTWELDQKINERGIPVDLDLIRGAQLITDREMLRLKAKLKDMTGLENPNSTEQMLTFLQTQCGYPFSSLNKAFVLRATTGEGGLTDFGKEILEIRKMTSKSSVNKFLAISNNVSSDQRLRHQFVFYGAARTGRWSGKDAQLQNLPRPTKEVEKNMDRAVDLVRKMDVEAVTREFTHPLDVVSSVIRASFRAPEGHHFVIADLAGIETRGVGFVSDCQSILDVYRQGRDAYIEFGARMFNKPYEEITKEERQKAKVPVLGCCYGLGGGEEKTTEDGDVYRSGLWGYAASMSVEMTQQEAHEAVRVYRETYPEVVKFWWNLQEAAVSAIRNPGEVFEVGPTSFQCVGKKVLRMILPSGRSLHYIRPTVQTKEVEGRNGLYKRTEITYEGKEQGTHAWTPQMLIGSKICENLVQAAARDILVVGMHRAESAGFSIVAHVHDELVCLVADDSPLGVKELCDCMSAPVPWAGEALPLAADGFSSKIYRKN